MADPTKDQQAGDYAPSVDGLEGVEKREIAQWLEGQWQEAVAGREGGTHPRDKKWQDHYDQYWGRYDTSKKAEWQAREVMPEVPAFVDRFAAQMKRALTAGGDFFDVEDPADEERDLAQAVERVERVWLDRCGVGLGGHPVAFASVFEDVMKLGALALSPMRVTQGKAGPRVAPVDPMRLWWDPTGRGLYRVWRYEVDKHELMGLRGRPGYDARAIEELASQVDELHRNDDLRRKGTSEEIISGRKPVYVDEFYGSIVDHEGEVRARNVLTLRANGTTIIRGPEVNPFWHGRDPIVATPLVTVPLAPYGRAYAENMASVARTFVEMTNLVLDGAFMGAMKAFAMQPELLLNPGQAKDGVFPNVTFLLEGGADVKQFLNAVDLGGLTQEAVTIWQALKRELELAALSSSLEMGQFAPNGRTSAQEIGAVTSGPGEQLAAMAETVEQRLLEPTLQLVWMTGLQFARRDDPQLARVAGEEMWNVMWQRKRELIKRDVTFRVRALSNKVEKAQKLQRVLQLLQVVFSNPMFAQVFMQTKDPGRIVDTLFELAGIDTKPMELTARERLMQQFAMAQGAGRGLPGSTTPSPLRPGK